MDIAVVGAGYVGLVTGTCLADAGNRVTVMDVDGRKIQALSSGRIPIFEPGLEELVGKNAAAGRLRFTTSMEEAVSDSQIAFIAVGTPSGEDGSADLQHVISAARAIGLAMTQQTIVVSKSTVPVGTVEKISETVSDALSERGIEIPFAVVSNPEFLKEGAAIQDFMKPDRIVIGGDSGWALDKMRSLYASFVVRPEQMLVVDARSAELIKYAANAMLATRISFMNEIANLAETLGADITAIRQGLAADPRIGPHFLSAGCGYGGSCFPKDVRALIRIAQREGQELQVVRAVEIANEAQKEVMFRKFRNFYDPRGGLKGRTIAIWGLAFKPNTDDMREASSLVLIDELLIAGAHVRAYDPVAMKEARRVLGDQPGVEYCRSASAALAGADALAIVTEWDEFSRAELGMLAETLTDRFVVDGRNIFLPKDAAEAGLAYVSIGRPDAPVASRQAPEQARAGTHARPS